MADVKIQDLLATTTVADNDLFIVEDNADTKKITKSNLVSTLGINGKAPTVHTHSMSQITDYEEGIWVPRVRGGTTEGTGTYNFQYGAYTKIGNVVTVHCDIEWTGHSGTGQLQITDLPFTCAGLSAICQILTVNLTYSNELKAMVNANTNRISFFQQASEVGIIDRSMDTSARVLLNGTYRV